MNPIKEFLKAKGTVEFVADENKWEKYPMQIVVEGEVKTAFIQDADKSHNDEEHVLVVLLMVEGKVFKVVKVCQAPVTCEIDWDTVTCATTIESM